MFFSIKRIKSKVTNLIEFFSLLSYILEWKVAVFGVSFVEISAVFLN